MAALSTIHSVPGLLGSRVIPVGLESRLSIVQLPSSVPVRVYLNTLSVAALLITQMLAPSVTRSVALEFWLLRLKLLAALWLPDTRKAAPEYSQPSPVARRRERSFQAA